MWKRHVSPINKILSGLQHKNVRQINHLYAELKEINYEYITGKSKLEELSKQSVIAKRLEKTGIKESTKPINIIRIKKEGK